MKRILCAVLLSLPLAGFAQEHFESGSFWQVTGVDTEPGKFEAYVEDLNGLWRKQMEMMQEAGKVKSYKMFANVHPRDGEPDLWLFVEWTSAGAMMDTSYDEWEAMTDKLIGSMEKSRELSIERGKLRTIMSDVLLREIAFRD